MRKLLTLLVGVVMAACMAPTAHAQTAAFKTNLVSDALMSPNLGIELGLASNWTLQIEGQFNVWKIKDKDSASGLHHQWKHWYSSVEPRYWFCHRFAGHFISINAFGGEYNWGHLGIKTKFLGSDFSGLNTNRYKGMAVGAGFNYGYAWALAKHWNIEFEVGIGWAWTRYKTYEMGPDASPIQLERLGEEPHDHSCHNYFGPTKLALNIEYLF